MLDVKLSRYSHLKKKENNWNINNPFYLHAKWTLQISGYAFVFQPFKMKLRAIRPLFHFISTRICKICIALYSSLYIPFNPFVYGFRNAWGPFTKNNKVEFEFFFHVQNLIRFYCEKDRCNFVVCFSKSLIVEAF